MKCKQCKYVKVCMAQADMLGQVFDVNYDGEHGCTDFTPFTNADRIRGMSDEELANFLHNVVRKFMCEYCKEYERIKAAKGHANCNGECDKAYLEWLKQPAEEG